MVVLTWHRNQPQVMKIVKRCDRKRRPRSHRLYQLKEERREDLGVKERVEDRSFWGYLKGGLDHVRNFTSKDSPSRMQYREFRARFSKQGST
ncbi:Uncharacterized protein HZ326_8336 [Fusarium oxysporum f. sp. albedinis]|nr:Uncharacterized protein HZ326_8336 [Fusarium oxysporum f. sp. albedinis]